MNEKIILEQYVKGIISKEKAQELTGLKKAAFNRRINRLGYSNETHFFPGSQKPLIPKNDESFWKERHSEYIQGESIDKLTLKLGIKQNSIKDQFNKFNLPLKTKEQRYKDTFKHLKETNITKYSCEFPLQNKDVYEKMVSTNLKRHNIKNVSEIDEVKEKISQSHLNRSIEEIEESNQKRSNTNIATYGMQVSQVPEFKEQTKETNKLRYGGHPLQNEKIKKDREETNIEKYGYETPLLIPDIFNLRYQDSVKQKRIETLLKNKWTRLLPVLQSMNYELLEDYKGIFHNKNYLKYKIKHISCNTIFEDDLFALPRCPKCFNSTKQSIRELHIKKYIQNLGFSCESFKEDNLHLDIFIKNLNIAFEINGLYYHSIHKGVSDNRKDPNYHQKKSIKALDKGIELYHFWEDTNITLIEHKINNILKVNTLKIRGSDTIIKEIKPIQAKEFFDLTHLNKGVFGNFSIGLFFEDVLISAISLRPFMEDSNYVEIARFSNLPGYQIHGGFSKLLKYILKNHDYKKGIITYADRDYTPNWKKCVYSKYFKFLGTTQPMLYYTDLKQRYSRLKYQKYKLKELFPNTFDENLTATEILALNRIYPLYNSGNWKFILEIK